MLHRFRRPGFRKEVFPKIGDLWELNLLKPPIFGIFSRLSGKMDAARIPLVQRKMCLNACHEKRGSHLAVHHARLDMCAVTPSGAGCKYDCEGKEKCDLNNCGSWQRHKGTRRETPTGNFCRSCIPEGPLASKRVVCVSFHPDFRRAWGPEDQYDRETLRVAYRSGLNVVGLYL